MALVDVINLYWQFQLVLNNSAKKKN